MSKFAPIVDFIKKLFPNKDFIPLHEPQFLGNEKRNVLQTIESTFVSSVGQYVTEFEVNLADYIGSNYAVATVNGTSALHIALKLVGVQNDDEVLTQAFSFVATSNAISYLNAHPVFIDIDSTTLGLSYEALHNFLNKNVELVEGHAINKLTGRRIKACIPMHTFGFPCEIDLINELCQAYKIVVVEDAAESIGSFYKDKHTGTFGKVGIFSFNGNKTITCGGGGAIVTDDENLAKKAKHLTTQAKVAHPWEFIHDEIGYNYRMPNINAALGCAQLESLDHIISRKRSLSGRYREFFEKSGIKYISENEHSRSNFWLNTIFLKNKKEREEFLTYTNSNGVMTRPVWKLMTDLKMYSNCVSDDLVNSRLISDKLINLPSSINFE